MYALAYVKRNFGPQVPTSSHGLGWGGKWFNSDESVSCSCPLIPLFIFFGCASTWTNSMVRYELKILLCTCCIEYIWYLLLTFFGNGPSEEISNSVLLGDCPVVLLCCYCCVPFPVPTEQTNRDSYMLAGTCTWTANGDPHHPLELD